MSKTIPEILRDAAAEFDKFDLCQNTWTNYAKNQICLSTALVRGCGKYGVMSIPSTPVGMYLHTKGYLTVSDEERSKIEVWIADNPICNWNNVVGRTKEQIVAMLNKAANEFVLEPA